MNFKKACLFLLSALMVAAIGSAQLSQTGNLNGTVLGQDGQPLPGVIVTIKSPAMILPQMDMITADSGLFRFPALSPGEYQVTFKLEGFKTLVRDRIKIGVGVTTTLDVTLELSPIEETVTVTGRAPTVDRQRTTLAANLTTEFLQSIPATRTLATFFNMVPGVTGSTTHGSSERDNTFNLDGVNVTDPVTGTQAGTFSVDIMEELSVQTGGLPAEYGSVRGGVVNVVTKSGGNKFSGMASFYFRNDKFQSDNLKGTIFEGQKSGFDYEYEPGFNFGGPIIKDKIWFYGNFSLMKSQEFLPGYPFDKQPTNTPLDYFRLYPYGKITYQITKSDKLVLAFNFSEYKRNHRGAAVNYTEDATWKQTTPIYTYNIQWTKFFGSNFFMNLKAGVMDYHLNLTAKNDKPRIYDSTLRQYSESYGYDDIYERNRFQAMTDATYFVDNLMGSHEFKAGIETEFSSDSRYRRHNHLSVSGLGPFVTVRNGVPYYVTHYIDFTRKDKKFVIGGFVQDSWTPTGRLTLNIGFRFDHQEGIIPKQGEEREPVTYGGITYDVAVREAFKPIIWNTLAPRLGATYDLTGDGKTILKASFSRYYVANILQWFVTVNPNSFVYWREYLNADWTSKGVKSNFGATANAKMDPDLKAPYIDEFTIGVEREIIRDVSLSVRYIRKWDRDLIEDLDLNGFDWEAYKNGADMLDPAIWTNWKQVYVVDPYTGKTVYFWNKVDSSLPWKGFITNPRDCKRDYDGLEVTLNKRLSNRWQMMVSYVYAHSRGLIGTDFDDSWSGQSYFDNPNTHINAMGEFGVERRHQFKVQGFVQGPWGINFSGYFRYLDGNRYARSIRSQDLGLSLYTDTTIWAETRGSRKEPGYYMLDLRLEKTFRIPGNIGTAALFLDVFNVLNSQIVTSIQTVSSSALTVNNVPVDFGGSTGYSDPRIMRLGFKFMF
ncbi:MAG: TonB-dependent receptor [Candidatus Aminicenantales bacterium]